MTEEHVVEVKNDEDNLNSVHLTEVCLSLTLSLSIDIIIFVRFHPGIVSVYACIHVCMLVYMNVFLCLFEMFVCDYSNNSNEHPKFIKLV